jgi:hypothetical protein
MNEERKKLGSDPLGWIKPTYEEQNFQNTNKESIKTNQQGLSNDWTRATFIIRKDILEKLKDFAYTDRRTIKDIINEALKNYLNGKEVIKRKKTENNEF